MNIQRFFERIEQSGLTVYGVEVWEDGRLTGTWGDTEENRYDLYSVTKSITSIAAGMAADEGKLDLNKSILEYMPKEILTDLPEKQLQVYRPITVRRLLCMSVPEYPFTFACKSNWLKEALNFPLEHPEESGFEYSNFCPYLIGAAVENVMAEDLYEFLQRKLFRPLGIQDPPCRRSPEGIFYGASGLKLTVNEMSRIGLIWYHGGELEGTRFLSEAYVREATSVQQTNREGGYGYFLWKYRDGYSMNGMSGKKCYILPRQRLMISWLADIDHDPGTIRSLMETNILNGCS